MIDDKFMVAFAEEVKFHLNMLNESKYKLFLRRENCDPRLKNIQSLPIPGIIDNMLLLETEIPLDYEIYVEIKGSIIYIQKYIKFDLNDPNSIDDMKLLFNDLSKLNALYSTCRTLCCKNTYRALLG